MEKIDAMMALTDLFDYDEYVAMCESNNLEAVPVWSYAQQAGMLSVAIRRHTGVSPRQAYDRYIDEMNVALEPKAPEKQRPPLPKAEKTEPGGGGKKGCCGGGARKRTGGRLR